MFLEKLEQYKKLVDAGKNIETITTFYDSKKNGPQRLQEAFIQCWRNGKIIYVRYYYGNPQPQK